MDEVAERAKQTVGTVWNLVFSDEYDYTFLTVLAIVGIYIYVVDLGATPLRGWDEGMYANVARHMVQDGYWLRPHIDWLVGTNAQFQPHLEKPPLVMWLQGFSMVVLGINEFAARLPSALSVVMTGGVVYLLGRALYNRLTGVLAGFVFLTSLYLFAGTNAGRQATLDAPLLLFGTIFVACTWFAVRRNDDRYILVACGAATLAVMAKGFAAGVYLFVVLPVVVTNWRFFFSRKLGVGIGIAATVVGLWSGLMYVIYGSTFIQQIFVEQVLARITGSKFVSTPGLFPFMDYPYFEMLPVIYDPWFFYLIPVLVAVLLITYQAKESVFRAIYLIWWAASILVFYAFTGNHGWYLLPMFVPASLLIGRTFAISRESTVARAGTILGTISAVVFSFRSPSPFAIEPRLHPYQPLGNLSGLIYPLVLVVGTVLLLTYPIIRDRIKSQISSTNYRITSHVGPVLAVLLITGGIAGPLSPPGAGYQEELARDVESSTPEDAIIFVHEAATNQFSNQLLAFAFYADRKYKPVTSSQLNQNDTIQYAVITPEQKDKIEREYTVVGNMTRQWAGTNLVIEFKQG